MRISDWSSDVCSSDPPSVARPEPLYSRAGRQAEPMAIANLITLTDAAAGRVKELIAKSGEPVLGLRVGVNTRGCTGMSYVEIGRAAGRERGGQYVLDSVVAGVLKNKQRTKKKK